MVVQHLLTNIYGMALCGYNALADPVGGLRGLQPPLNFPKIVVIRVVVVIDLVVTSSNHACLCSSNGVAV